MTSARGRVGTIGFIDRETRAGRLIARAADLLERDANDLRDSDTLQDGKWPATPIDQKARLEYLDLVKAARGLRGFLTGKKRATRAAPPILTRQP